MLSNKSLLVWYMIVCLELLLFGVAAMFDVHYMIWENDLTKLSAVIAVVWVLGTLFIGSHYFYNNKDYIESRIKIGWFISESCSALGMIGTVAGFLLMLGAAFTNIDVSSSESMQLVISNMALGMSTALYTTLVGLVCSLLLKIQLVNVEYYIDSLSTQDSTSKKMLLG